MKNILPNAIFARTASTEDIPPDISMFLVSPGIYAISMEKNIQIREIIFKLSVKCSLVTKSISKSFLFLLLTKNPIKAQIFSIQKVIVRRKTKE